MEDSIGDRVWVDLDQCKKLVDNICITFQTKLPSSQSLGEGGSSSGSKSSGGETTAGPGGGGGGGEREDSGGLILSDVDVEPR